MSTIPHLLRDKRREPFKWEPLVTPTSIRVLTLAAAGQNVKTIRCSMTEIDLRTSPIYRALSYTWGLNQVRQRLRPPPKRSIICNDKTIKIAENLYFALRYLQSLGEDTPIWIDAISIHQRDKEECAYQVQMMGQIYRSAVKVIVWLGQGDPFSRKAMQWIKANCDGKRAIEVSLDTSLRAKHLFQVEIEELLGAVTRKDRSKLTFSESIKDIAGEASLPYLFFSRWFNRVWVLQEAILAQELIFALGDCAVSDKAMYRGLGHALKVQRQRTVKEFRGLRHFQQYGENQLVHLHSVRTMFETRFTMESGEYGQGSLLDYLLLGWNRRSSDTKDKVYGILGLVSEQNQQVSTSEHHWTGLAVNYTQDTREVFLECCRLILSSDVTFSGLSLATGLSPSKIPPAVISWTEVNRKWHRVFGSEFIECGVANLPSWAIDFTCAAEPRPFIFVYDQSFNAGGHDKTRSPTFNQSGTILQLQGHIWDSVEMVGEDSTVLSSGGYYYFAGDILRMLSKVGHTYLPTDESLLRAFSRTMTANHPSVKEEAEKTFLQCVGGIDFLNWLVNIVEGALKEQEKHNRWQNASERILKDPIDADQKARFRNDGRRSLEAHRASVKTAWDEFLKKVDRDGHVQDTIDVVRRPNRITPFWIVWRYVYQHRRIFLTEKGYLGIGPRAMKVGDEVVIIPGAAVPFVLRKLDDTWLLVGEAYVHGIMDGEVMKGDDVIITNIQIS